jgi:hypothetical protein
MGLGAPTARCNSPLRPRQGRLPRVTSPPHGSLGLRLRPLIELFNTLLDPTFGIDIHRSAQPTEPAGTLPGSFFDLS